LNIIFVLIQIIRFVCFQIPEDEQECSDDEEEVARKKRLKEASKNNSKSTSNKSIIHNDNTGDSIPPAPRAANKRSRVKSTFPPQNNPSAVNSHSYPHPHTANSSPIFSVPSISQLSSINPYPSHHPSPNHMNPSYYPNPYPPAQWIGGPLSYPSIPVNVGYNQGFSGQSYGNIAAQFVSPVVHAPSNQIANPPVYTYKPLPKL